MDADPPGHAIFDENDLIVFVAHDGGERSETQGKELGAISIAEVEAFFIFPGNNDFTHQT